VGGIGDAASEGGVCGLGAKGRRRRKKEEEQEGGDSAHVLHLVLAGSK